MSYLGTRLPEELAQGLNKICHLTKRSKSSIVQEALATYIEDHEEYYAAIEAFEQFKKDGYQTISWEDVKKANGLLDDDELDA